MVEIIVAVPVAAAAIQSQGVNVPFSDSAKVRAMVATACAMVPMTFAAGSSIELRACPTDWMEDAAFFHESATVFPPSASSPDFDI